MKTNKKAARRKIKAKLKILKKARGRGIKIPPNQVIPDKSQEKIRKNKFNNEIKELLKEELGDDILCRPDGGRDGSGYLM